MPLNRELNRSKSFDLPGEENGDLSSKYKTATPSLLVRLTHGTFKKRAPRERSESDDSSAALDDLICLDSFEEEGENGAPRIDITQDNLRYAILEQLRSIGSHVDVFADVEKAQVSDNTFNQYSHLERSVAFLAAAFLNRHDLFNYFVAMKVDENFSEMKYGFSAIHIAAFTGAAAFCDLLISNGTSVNPTNGLYSPLHCAALLNHSDIACKLVAAGASLEKSHPAGEPPLASAVRSHSIACVESLVNLGADVNVADASGVTPLHLACDLGDVETTRILLDSKRCIVDIQTRSEQNTALHLAAQGGSIEIVQMLLDCGASPNSKNARLKTPLHFASRVCHECTKTLLKKGADPNAADVEKRTPLHTAVARSEVRFGAEITKLLLSWSAAVNLQDRYGYTPLHIAALNERSDCAEALVRHGANVTARTRGGTVALGLVARKTPSALAVIRDVLDSYITSNDPEVSYREVKLTFNFKYLLKDCGREEMNFLQTIVNEGQRTLLEHPLCEAFLHLKWQKIRKYYTARLLFGFLFVCLLSSYVLIVLAYQCYGEPQPEVELSVRDFGFKKIEVDRSLCEKKSVFGQWLLDHSIVVEAEYHLLSLVAILEVLRKIYGMNGYKSVREYFNVSNIVEWFVVASVPAIAYHFMSKDNVLWQNHIGAFAVLVGWANLMIMIGHLPIFGSYVAMYTKVQKEFAKLLSAYICLLIGFTVCFCAMFVKSEAFANPFVGFVKILVMMTGEFDFGDLLSDINKEQGKSDEGVLKKSFTAEDESPMEDTHTTAYILQASALITFVLFLLFVTIILINLLIGIAVHDIQGLQKTAGLSKLVGLTNLISHIEAALFGRRVPACIVRPLSATSGVPSLLVVSPLNSRENRLPREILRAGLEVVKQQRGKRSVEVKRQAFTMRPETIGDCLSSDLYDAVFRLTEEVRELRQLILSSNRELSEGTVRI